MKRILCLWFPNWPVQRRLLFSRDAESSERSALPSKTRVAAKQTDLLILHAPIHGKPRVVACSRAARQAGVKPGMLLAEAEALTMLPSPSASGGEGPGVRGVFEPHDPHADREALRQLALRCQRFTPLVAIENAEMPDSILLDVTGCGYGFGGLEGLAHCAVGWAQSSEPTDWKMVGSEDSTDPTYFAVAALADTVGAAWALAHYGGMAARVHIVSPGEHEAALRPLPIEALRLPADIVELLHDFDIQRIEQLLALPRRELPCRFGPDLLHRLDQALGVVPELIEPEPQDDPIQASWPFEPPIADARLLDQTIAYLLDRVLERVRPTNLGIQRMLCSLTLATGEPVRIPVGLVRPSATFSHLIDLLRLHLERVHVTAEIAEVSLFVPCVAPLEFRQDEIFDGMPGVQPLAPLVERLMSRLGENAILRPELNADPQPEWGWNAERRMQNAELQEPTTATQRFCILRSAFCNYFRPPHLERRPVAVAVMSVVPGGPPLSFEWKGRSHRIAHAWGPERIETGWWRGDDIRRDYYQIETAGGERYWLFRRLTDERWFLHGVFV